MTEPRDHYEELPPPAAKPARRGRKTLWLVLFLLVAAGVWYEGWYVLGKKTNDAGKNKSAPVIIATVGRQNMPVELEALGTVQAFNTVTVHTRVDGQLMALKFIEGQMVKIGDVLAKLDDRPFRASRDQAAANLQRDAAVLANNQKDLQRYQSMGDSISRQTVDTQVATVKEAQALVASDKAALESAQTQLDYCTITSPINGRTGIRAVDVGNIVHAADANGIVVLTQMEPISIFFSLPQQNLPEIMAQIDAGTKLSADALAADHQAVLDSGTLDLVDNEIDQTTGTIRLRGTFPNQKHTLWPGAFVNVRLHVSDHPNAIVIPTVAIQRGPKGAYVFRYNANDKEVNIVPVDVGIIRGEESEILSGLNDGDKIVTDGMAKLQDKTKVRLSKSTHENEDKPASATTDATNPGATPQATAVPDKNDTTDTDKKDADKKSKHADHASPSDGASKSAPATADTAANPPSDTSATPSANNASDNASAASSDATNSNSSATHRTLSANDPNADSTAPVPPGHKVHDLSQQKD